MNYIIPATESQVESDIDVRTRLLDSAEELFAKYGLADVSIRDIVGKAKANLGAINYYFGSKEKLIAEVFERRLIPLNRERFQMLDTLEKNLEYLTVEQILEAVFRPTLNSRLQSSHGGKAFTTLLGRSILEPRPHVEQLLKAHFTPLIDRLEKLLIFILPHLSKEEIFWRLSFAFGALHRWLLLNDTWIPVAASGVTQEDQLQKLISFTAAGLKAPLS